MKKIFLNLILFGLLAFIGCLKDAPVVQANSEENNSADILIYLESQGDYINSQQMPSLITSTEVYNNPSDKIILDIRSSGDFATGHIQNAINISPAEIINYLDTSDPNKTVVIVSLTGQSASYYTSLLRFYGYTNAFTLKYGMTAWNNDFASKWINHMQHKGLFNNKVNNKPAFSPLPKLTFSNSGDNIKEKVNSRIQELMSIDFSESDESEISISVQNLNTIYSTLTEEYANTFIVCYAQNQGEYILGSSLDNPGHLPSAVYYQDNSFEASDLRSSANLQTIPSNKDIVVYSRIGHSSAFITAYLRVLGYNARSLLFGMKWLFGFDQSQVKNYPYITGS